LTTHQSRSAAFQCVLQHKVTIRDFILIMGLVNIKEGSRVIVKNVLKVTATLNEAT